MKALYVLRHFIVQSLPSAVIHMTNEANHLVKLGQEVVCQNIITSEPSFPPSSLH